MSTVLCKAVGALFAVLTLVAFFASLGVDLKFANDAFGRAEARGAASALSTEANVVAQLTELTTGYTRSARALGSVAGVANLKCAAANAAELSRTFQQLDAVRAASPGMSMAYFGFRRAAGGASWGLCGCYATGASYECVRVAEDGVATVYATTSTAVVRRTIAAADVPATAFGAAAAELTAADAKGKWFRPAVNRLPTGAASAGITYGVPTAFGADGRATAAALVDVPLSQFTAGSDAVVQSVLLDTRPQAALGNEPALISTFAALPATATPRLYSALTTPSAVSNEFVTTTRDSVLGGGYVPAGGAGLPTATHQGMVYVVRPLLGGDWVVYTRAPLQTSVDTVVNAFVGLFRTYSTAVHSLAAAWAADTTQCYAASLAGQATTDFFAASYATDAAFDDVMVYSYTSFALPSNAAKWGHCGCSSAINNDDCYFIDNSGVWHNTRGANLTATYGAMNLTVENHREVQALMHMTRADSAGSWMQPYLFTLPGKGFASAFTTFNVPVSFNTSGLCDVGMSVDINLVSLGTYLRGWIESDDARTAKTKRVYVVDTRGDNLLVASSHHSFPVTSTEGVYPILATPDAQLNELMRKVQALLGGSFAKTMAAPVGDSLVVARYSAPWAFIEVQDAAQVSLLSVAGAEDEVKEAAAMYTSAEKAGIGALAALVVLIVLADKLLMLVLAGRGGPARSAHTDAEYKEAPLQ